MSDENPAWVRPVDAGEILTAGRGLKIYTPSMNRQDRKRTLWWFEIARFALNAIALAATLWMMADQRDALRPTGNDFHDAAVQSAYQSGGLHWGDIIPLLLIANVLFTVMEVIVVFAWSRVMKLVVRISIILLVCLLGLVAVGLWLTTPNLDEESAKAKARALIERAGGIDVVSNEASNLFRRFGHEDRVFGDDELKDYPHLLSLGTINGIFQGSGFSSYPDHINIHVGTHFDGFMIQISEPGGRFAEEPSWPIYTNVQVHR